MIPICAKEKPHSRTGESLVYHPDSEWILPPAFQRQTIVGHEDAQKKFDGFVYGTLQCRICGEQQYWVRECQELNAAEVMAYALRNRPLKIG